MVGGIHPDHCAQSIDSLIDGFPKLRSIVVRRVFWPLVARGFVRRSDRGFGWNRSMDAPFDELLALEHAGWASLCDGTGGEFYGRTMTTDVRMILADGMTMARSEVVESLEHAPLRDSYDIDDAALLDLDDDAVALAYSGTGHCDDGDDFTASTHVSDDSRWRLALSQQAPTS